MNWVIFVVQNFDKRSAALREGIGIFGHVDLYLLTVTIMSSILFAGIGYLLYYNCFIMCKESMERKGEEEKTKSPPYWMYFLYCVYKGFPRRTTEVKRNTTKRKRRRNR